MARTKHKSITIEFPVEETGNPIPALDRLTVRIDDAAHLLSVSRAAVYRLLGSGEIEASKSGQKTMVIVASLKAFIERNRVEIRSARPAAGER
jgi:excisionase family DNA binding protein